MSLYNALFGVNPHAPMLLSFLGITANDVPRFRDCYVKDGKIAIHTRTGGGNRLAYESPESYREEYGADEEPVGPWNSDLRALPGFIHDEDDDFDCTYATFYYQPSPDVAKLVVQLSEVGGENSAERWQKLFADMAARKDNPQVARALEVGKPIVEAISAHFASVDRSPKGEKPQALNAQHESAVPEGQTPNTHSDSEAPDNG